VWKCLYAKAASIRREISQLFFPSLRFGKNAIEMTTYFMGGGEKMKIRPLVNHFQWRGRIFIFSIPSPNTFVTSKDENRNVVEV